MKITSSVEYATRLMVCLARRRGQPPASAEALSESENVPADYVNQILLRLKRAGLVESHRGASGGYGLAREPEMITLGQVISAVEGHIFEDVCGKFDGGARDCRHQGRCGISPVWTKLSALIENFLNSVTLASLSAESASGAAALEAIRTSRSL